MTTSAPTPSAPVPPPPWSTTSLDELMSRPAAQHVRRAVPILCCVVTTLDGFDNQSIALAAPAISAEWGVPAAAFASVFAIGLVGSLLGTVFLGRLGDRYGRRRIVLLSVALFAVGSLLTPLVSSIPGLIATRLVTGIGLGGALPGAITLTSEFASPHRRSGVVGLMFCGFPLGGVLAGVCAAPMVPAFGWASVFLVGGIVPLLLLPLLWWMLPESPQYLLLRDDRAGLERLLKRLGAAGTPLTPAQEAPRSPVSKLFAEGRGAGTVLLWVTLFLALLFAYLLVNWIPLVTSAAGAGAGGASLAAATLNVGAIVGCLVLGRIADRRQATLVVGSGFVLGAVSIAALGLVAGSTGGLLMVTFLAGFFGIGSQMCLAAVCAAFYDASARATGVGAAMGVGRIGGILGPVLGGVLLSVGYAASMIFLITAGAAILAAVAIIGMGRAARRVTRPEVVR